MTIRTDAVVIGAGPAGSATAIVLARAGWSVAIVEKKPFPRRKVCGEFISAASLPVLDDLGVGAAFRALAGPDVRRVGIFAGDAVLSSPMPQADAPGCGWGRALGRDVLDTLLLDRAVAAGARLWQPWSVVELSPFDGGMRCRIASRGEEQMLAAPIVIAAHGSWERGPLATQPTRRNRASDFLGFKAHFSKAHLPAGLMPLLAFPGGYGGAVHTDGRRVGLSCCIRRDALDRVRARHGGDSAGEAVFRHIAASSRGVREAFGGAALDGGWLAAGPIDPGIRSRYGSGIFRVGNAAGEAHPVVAEGISMALQAGYMLGGRLALRRNELDDLRVRDAIGRGYSAAWRARFAGRIHAAALFAAFASRPAVSDIVLPVLRRFPAILTLGAQWSGKTEAMAPGV